MRKLYFWICFLVFCTATHSPCLAQLTIAPGSTATALANKLVGAGVVIISPTLTCPSIANGTFTGSSTLGFDSGIVLSTGRVATSGFSFGAGGPATNFASTNNAAAGDTMLSILAGQSTKDACVLEFDFRPSGDTVRFNYVFGSEEYTNFACSEFNDVFGFFISAPGYSAATNRALVPGTSIPVCINSVNCGATGTGILANCTAMGSGSPFCAYYVNNLGGASITYDGLTTTLEALARVTPCDTYHLKIGIADGLDFSYDSGVFLKAGSLKSTGVSITPLGINPLDTASGGQYCVRGCIPGQFIFNLPAPATAPLSIRFLIAGTAVAGTDYTAIADSIVFPVGAVSDTVFINPLVVSSATGPRTVSLLILAPHACGDPSFIVDSASITIFDSFNVRILSRDTTVCPGRSVSLLATGDTFLQYHWSPASSLSTSTGLSTIATPPVTLTYTLTGSWPGGGCVPSTDVVSVTINNPLIVDAGPPVQTICKGSPHTFNTLVTPASGGYSYSWSPAVFLNSTTIASPVATPTITGDFRYFVTVVDTVGGCVASDSVLLHVLPDGFLLLNNDSSMCFRGEIPVQAEGDSAFSYRWIPSSAVSDPHIINPVLHVTTTTAYTLTASFPGCSDITRVVKFVVQSPQADILFGDTMFCIGDSIQMKVALATSDTIVSYSWSPTSNFVNPSLLEPVFAVPGIGDYPVTLTVMSSLGCASTASVTMSPRPAANVGITPGPLSVKYGESIQLNATNLTAFNLIYYWTPANGSLNNPNISNPVATPTTETQYVVHVMNEWGCRDSAKVLIKVNDGEDVFIPTAFSPNGDGRNDVFRVPFLKYHKLADFSIYNRWGQVVYRNNSDPTSGWDGTINGVPQDMGVYNYQIIINKPDGSEKVLKGEVTLVR